MRLPNPHMAIVDEEKLANYCLNPLHPRGRHKARKFRSAIGFTQRDAAKLRQLLLAAAMTHDAQEGEADDYGQRYTLDFEVTGIAGKLVIIRSAWIVRSGEDFPRLTSCYVL